MMIHVYCYMSNCPCHNNHNLRIILKLHVITSFTKSIMQIISALFGRKIGTGPEKSTLFRCCNYPHQDQTSEWERNSKIMRIISKVRSKVPFSRTLICLFEVFLMGARKKKGADYFRSSEFVNAIFIELSALFLCG